ncbi:MAG: DUF4358 domain-containing protein [Ruminococcaceae bacterium]|nr:DUF4358 domain-containing protein [Oscillospiraceae bacterium]
MNKFKMTIAALTMASLLLTGCGKDEAAETGEGTSEAAVQQTSAKSPAEKTAELLDAVEFPEMVEVTSDKLLAYYLIDEADIADMSAYRVGSGAYPDQFGIFVAVDADAAGRVKSAIESYVERLVRYGQYGYKIGNVRIGRSKWDQTDTDAGIKT